MRIARIFLGVRFGSLLLVKRVVHRLHLLGLIEIDVVLIVAGDAVAVVDRPAPSRSRLRVAVAAERQMMAAEEPGIRRLAFGLAKNCHAAALERAAGIPLAVAREPFE